MLSLANTLNNYASVGYHGLTSRIRSIQTRVSQEFTPAANHLGHKKFESRQNNPFFLKPISSARVLFFQPMAMEYLSNFTRMVPRLARDAK